MAAHGGPARVVQREHVRAGCLVDDLVGVPQGAQRRVGQRGHGLALIATYILPLVTGASEAPAPAGPYRTDGRAPMADQGAAIPRRVTPRITRRRKPIDPQSVQP